MIKRDKIVRAYVETQLDFEREIILENVLVGEWEADLLVIDDLGFSHEYETKTSRTAFFNGIKEDSPHVKHDLESFFKTEKGENYTFNTYTLILPQDAVKPAEIPEHIGLVYYHQETESKEIRFTAERLPKMLHNNDFWSMFDKSAFIRTLCRRFFYKDF